MTGSFTFDALGTTWTIDTQENLPEEARTAVRDRIDTFDAVYSRFRPDSLVTRIAHEDHGGHFTFPPDAGALFDLYDRLWDVSSGAVDPLVGGDLERLGYDAQYTLRPRPHTGQARPSWPADVTRTGTSISTTRPVVIDVGAAGKGHLADIVSTVLTDLGHPDHVVDASGDIVHHHRTPLRVGLQHPRATDRVIGVVELDHMALCASSTLRRAWGNGIHHVIDGRTGQPTSDVLATWAIAPDALTADGAATALFFPAADSSALGVQWVRLLTDGRVQWSHDFTGELFI